MAVGTAPDLQSCESYDDLREVARGAPELIRRMMREGSGPREIGQAVSDIADAVTVRLIRLAEQRLGPPPIDYAWAAAGSQGRRELTAGSDQDNALILGDGYDAARHGSYFKDLSTFVCDGLDACGYVYCPGEMMAATERWRQPLAVWREYFRVWIEEPQPKALMLASVFFDFRVVSGSAPLFDTMHESVLDLSRRNTIFLAYLASNAQSRQPPLGFFGNLQLAHGGEHDGTLDIKINGVTPIVEMARVHALSIGLPQVNTFERLEALGAAGVISESGMRDLLDALDFIGKLRLRHQVRMAEEGRRPDNHMSPDELSTEERRHLKSAFKAVKIMQSAMNAKYRHGFV
jgi:CBS domain-containing protein